MTPPKPLIIPKELLCAKCQTYVALPAVNRDVPPIRHDWLDASDNERFVVSHPLLPRTGAELCYTCQKYEDGLMKCTNLEPFTGYWL